MDLSLVSTAASNSMCQTLAGDNATSIIDALGDNFPIVVIFGVGGIIAVVAILFTTLSGVANTKEREKTKRELAAYVAEGSMTPADAEKLLKSSKDS